MRLAVLGLCLLPFSAALALTPLELFEEGNRLYRDELYWAALLRYEQANEAGLSTPLLFYNTGVTHYRAGQYDRARNALMQAIGSPELYLATQYNLGLVEYADGNVSAALQWFRLVRDQQANRKLSAYATEAIARIRAEELEGIGEVSVSAPLRVEDEKVGHFDFYAMAGFGTDDNVYRTPRGRYVDYSKPNTPTVGMEPFSGSYIPFEFGATYRIDSYPDENFFAAYRLDGVTYPDSALNDADEYAQELSLGSAFRRYDEDGQHGREIYSAFSISQHQEQYFDPSTGTYFFIINDDGDYEDFPDRMDYVRYGPEINYRQNFSKLTFGVGFKGQLWNYTDTRTVPEYDHEYLVLDAFAQYRVLPSSLVRLRTRISTRIFGDRPAYTLDGEVLSTNPDLEYTYLDLGLDLRQRITDTMWFGIGYTRSERTDKFVGYQDYTRDQYTFTFRWHAGYRLDFDFFGSYMLYDYPRALAFNNPTQPLKTLDILDGGVRATFRLTEHLFIVGEGTYVDSRSNDTRVSYYRGQYSIGIRWEQ